jgi:hypothetical protein
MNLREELCASIDDPELLFADGFDEAILGVCWTGILVSKIVYSASKMVQILVDRDGMTHEEASEYLAFNTFGSYVGERTPIYVDDTILALQNPESFRISVPKKPKPPGADQVPGKEKA